MQPNMTGRDVLRRKLRWMESGFYVAGVVLLAVFFVIRHEGEKQRAEGVEQFRQAQAVAAVPPGDSTPAEMTDPRLDAGLAQPDQSQWDPKRIREYQESLAVAAEPPLAVMSIDKLDIEVPVYDGADDFNLNRGVARITGTARIDASGNLGIAGHRDGFFRGLKDITIGDSIELQTHRGRTRYTVAAIDIVDPSDVSVLSPTESPTLTLVTCYPFYYVGHAPKRFIVRATAEHSFATI